MGGLGSGNRCRHSARTTTDGCRNLDIRQLARAGALKPGYVGWWNWMRGAETVASIQMRAEHDYVVLMYRYRPRDGQWKDEQYPVRIERTPCNFGAERCWFICPAAACGRRVDILYGGGIFACRHCHRLAYASTREGEHSRAIRQADRLRARLGWQLGVMNEAGAKPKWMRRRTFERLAARHEELVTRLMRLTIMRFGLID